MRNGEIREQGTGEADLRDAAGRLHQGAARVPPARSTAGPMRLPVIDDFMNGSAGRGEPARSARAASTGGDPIVLEVRNLGKSFYSREGLFGKREFKAVKDVSFKLPKGKTLGLVGESGSGKTTVGLTLMRLHEATTRRGAVRGHGPPGDVRQASSCRTSAASRSSSRIRTRRSIRASPSARSSIEPMQIHGIGTQRAGAHRPGVRAAEARSACRKSRSTSIRTSSPAASASASPSRAA